MSETPPNTARTLGARLNAAMTARGLHPAKLARAAHTTEATVSNWLLDRIHADHVKAALLFRLADAVHLNPRELLLGHTESTVAEAAAQYVSHSVKRDLLTIAARLIIEDLDRRNVTLSAGELAEAVTLAYDLLEEGLPDAKVLRFVKAAVG